MTDFTEPKSPVGEDNKRGSARAIFDVPITTSELLYVFCAAAWVISVDHMTAKPITPPTILLLGSTFCFIPLDIYSGTLWSQAASMYVRSSQSRPEKDIVLVGFDLLRVFVLTLLFFLLPNINESINREDHGLAEKNANVAVFLTGSLLLLGFLWNAILFKAKPPEWYSYYDRIFRKYQHEVTEARAGEQNSSATIVLFDGSIKGFKNFNKLMFVYVYPIFSVYLLFSAFDLNLKNESRLKQAIDDLPFCVIPSYYFYSWLILFIMLTQSFMKMLHILFLSLMISEGLWAKLKLQEQEANRNPADVGAPA